ncbi:MAG: hypothetical protein GC159_14760 [Phycisphaera sp.]|nr:hypothetical protein [Phycisphaera sp.]
MPLQVLAIAKNTFVESIRQPIYVVMLGVIALLLVMNLAFSKYTLDDDNKLLLDIGISSIYIGGFILAAFTATGVLSREIENKTVLTVISKPIGRPLFVLGKYIGVTGAIGLAFWIWSIFFLLSVRHQVMQRASDPIDIPVIVFGGGAVLLALFVAVWGNYFYGWVFSSKLSAILAVTLPVAYIMVLMINKKLEFQPITYEFTMHDSQLGQIMIVLLLLMQFLAVACAIAVACSTRLGLVMTLFICLGIFWFLSPAADSFFGKHTTAHPAAWGPYVLVPNVGFVFLADALTAGNDISLSYFLKVSAYCALYTTGTLGLAVALFQTRETG